MELKTCVTKMGHQSHPYIYNRKQKFSTCPTLDSTPSSEVSSRKLPLIPALSSPKLFTLHRLNDWLQKKMQLRSSPTDVPTGSPQRYQIPAPAAKSKKAKGGEVRKAWSPRKSKICQHCHQFRRLFNIHVRLGLLLSNYLEDINPWVD
jgi:hypothetical protein